MLIQGGQAYELCPIFLIIPVVLLISQLSKSSSNLLLVVYYFQGDRDLFCFRQTSCLLVLCGVNTHTHKYIPKTYIFLFVSHTTFPPFNILFSFRFTIYTFFQYPHLCKSTIPEWLICWYSLFLNFCLICMFVAYLINGITSGHTCTLSPDMLF